MIWLCGAKRGELCRKEGDGSGSPKKKQERNDYEKVVGRCSSYFVSVTQFFRTFGRAHAFARSVTVARSSAVQASSSRRQERRWAIVCGSPQSQSTD